MPRAIRDQIESLERRIAQEREQLRDLHAQASKRARKDDARRKIIYGAAYLEAIKGIDVDRRKKNLEFIEKYITRPCDRQFLGLSSPDASEGPSD